MRGWEISEEAKAQGGGGGPVGVRISEEDGVSHDMEAREKQALLVAWTLRLGLSGP